MSEETQENNVKSTPSTIGELRDAIFNKVTMIRPRKHDDSFQWFSPDAHVIGMTAAAVNSTAAAFDQNFWPGLVDLLNKSSDEKIDFEAEVFKAYEVIFKYLERCTDKDSGDMTFMDTLEAVGWNDMSEVGKVAYMSMYSQYFFARFWVACRQLLELGTPPAKVFDRIAQDTGDLMRMVNNNIDPSQEGVYRINKAVEFAVKAGLSDRTIETAVANAIVKARSE